MDTTIIYTGDKARGQTVVRELTNLYLMTFTVFTDAVEMERFILTTEMSIKGILLLSEEVEKIQELVIRVDKELPVFLDGDGQSVNEFLESQGIKKKKQNLNDLYMSIRFYDFMTFSISPCDVYIRMGISNHVKIMNKDEIFSKDILEHYRKKKITELYIKKEDAKAYLDDLHENLKDKLQNSSGTMKDIIAPLAGLDFIHSSLRMIGVDEHSLEVAELTINSVMKLLNGKSDVNKQVLELMSHPSYLSDHSLATATIACSLAKNLNLITEFTLKKLVMASLLHDIGLEDKELAHIQNCESKEFEELSIEKKRQFSEHVHASMDFLNKLPNVPANVDRIILEHHERPNGKGFPHGLDSFSISPLGAVLVVAEEFVHHIFRSGVSVKNRDEILERMSLEFNKGNYKGPMNSLLSLFL